MGQQGQLCLSRTQRIAATRQVTLVCGKGNGACMPQRSEMETSAGEPGTCPACMMVPMPNGNSTVTIVCRDDTHV